MARQPLKKSVRFEVFKRDSFTCQYCGQKSPDVVLEVDHITPVADGGDNDILNLVTACKACNAGKSDKTLADTTAIDKRRVQLEDLEQRRQQLEMLHQWHSSLIDIESEAVAKAGDLWFRSTGREGCCFTDEASAEIRRLIKRHGFADVCNAITEAADACGRSTKDAREASTEWFWKIGRILNTWRLEEKTPGLSRLLYIRGILRNRIHIYASGEWQSLKLLKAAHALGVPLDWMEATAKAVQSWADWRWLMEDAIAQYDCDSEEDEEATDGTHAQS